MKKIMNLENKRTTVRNTKQIFMAFAILLFICLIPNVVKASSTFSTKDGIVANKVGKGTDGTVEFKFTNIPLKSDGKYQWGIGTTSSSADVKKWYVLGDFNEKNKTATISLIPSEKEIKQILRTTDTAWIYIKDVTNNKFIVDGLKVDLALPPLNAFLITKSGFYDPSIPKNPAWEISCTYDISNHYYKLQKITDEKIIKQYISNNGDSAKISGLAGLENAPTGGWESTTKVNGFSRYSEVPNRAIPKEDGLYYLWVKGKDVDSKVVIGYTLVNIDIEAPTVKRISVQSPTSGTYKTSQTVKIRAYFSENITGSKVPTLKIKFGNSPVRTLTNGTISGDYIEYSYNIQDSDKGQLVTVGFEGGKITDAKGNAAKLSCPLISGNTIKANVEGTTTNNTDNQDKNNTNQDKNNSSNNDNNGKNEPIKVDNTIASGSLPKTGFGFGILGCLIVVVCISIIALVKYNKYKDIK